MSYVRKTSGSGIGCPLHLSEVKRIYELAREGLRAAAIAKILGRSDSNRARCIDGGRFGPRARAQRGQTQDYAHGGTPCDTPLVAAATPGAKQQQGTEKTRNCPGRGRGVWSTKQTNNRPVQEAGC